MRDEGGGGPNRLILWPTAVEIPTGVFQIDLGETMGFKRHKHDNVDHEAEIRRTIQRILTSPYQPMTDEDRGFVMGCIAANLDMSVQSGCEAGFLFALLRKDNEIKTKSEISGGTDTSSDSSFENLRSWQSEYEKRRAEEPRGVIGALLGRPLMRI